MRRMLVPAIPFALSLCLSLFTVGSSVTWQDSGFFLTGVKELGVLYPPGFVLYLVACKVWTLLLGFLDFTLVAALIGLGWAAHPSATNLGAAFLLFVAAHRRTLGGKGIAWRAGVAAACAIGPSLLLPLLALREPATMFGDPRSPGEWI